MSYYKYYCWRSFRRETTLMVIFAPSLKEAQRAYAAAHNLHICEVEGIRAGQ